MSFLGYGNQPPGSNINVDYVNKYSSSYAGGFGSNEIPTSCMRGGKKLKRKIKNITKQYKKMKGGQIKSQIMKQLSKSRSLTKSMAIAGGRRRSRMMSRRKGRRMTIRNRRVSRRRRQQRGGSYMSNVPNTPTYSTGGVLSAGSSALANPVPYNITSRNVNCVDNYNHVTGKGIQTV
jgi:hypothetical protein